MPTEVRRGHGKSCRCSYPQCVHTSPGLYPGLLLCCCDKHMSKSRLGEERVLSGLQGSQFFLKGELSAAYRPSPLADSATCSGHMPIIGNQDSASQICPKVSMMEAVLHLMFPSPGMSRFVSL